MHRALQYELFLGFQNAFLGDWSFPFLPVPGTGSVAQGVHQPRLAAGLGPHAVNRLRMELLAGLGGLLRAATRPRLQRSRLGVANRRLC